MAAVLLIEDEFGIQTLVQRILVRLGHQVTCASNGAEAMACARAQAYDLILSDYTLPGEPTGLELLKELRAAQPACQMAVLTGLADTARMDALREADIQHMLQKPFDVNQLRALVNSLLPPPA